MRNYQSVGSFIVGYLWDRCTPWEWKRIEIWHHSIVSINQSLERVAWNPTLIGNPTKTEKEETAEAVADFHAPHETCITTARMRFLFLLWKKVVRWLFLEVPYTKAQPKLLKWHINNHIMLNVIKFKLCYSPHKSSEIIEIYLCCSFRRVFASLWWILNATHFVLFWVFKLKLIHLNLSKKLPHTKHCKERETTAL